MSTPKCHEFEAYLEQAVERKVRLSDAPGADFSPHLSVCGACHLKWDQARALQRAFDDWATRLPEVDLVASVLQRWQDSLSTSQSDPTAATNTTATNTAATNAVATHTATASFPVGRTPVESETARHERSTPAGQQPSYRPPRRVSPQTGRAVLALTFAVLLFVGWRVAVVSVPANLPEEAVASVPHSPAVSENAINSAIKKTDSRPENRSHEFDVPTTSPLSQSAAEDVEITGLFREAGVAYLSLAGEAADVVRDAAALVSVPPSPGNSVVRASDNGDGNSAPEPEGPLSPWGRRFGAAVDFLFETDPADDTPSI